jgi:hypothetical protein
MAAGATYEKIATTTLSSPASEVNFTSISGAYTDIVLAANLGCSAGGNRAYWRVNGSSASDYGKIYMLGDGSSSGTSEETGITGSFIFDGIAVPTTLSGTLIQHYQNYSNTNMFKQVLSRCNHPTSGTMMVAGQWRQTSAITSIFLQATGSANWITGSTFTLYGILEA